MTSVRFAGIAKSFGSVVALQPTELDVAPGEFLTLLGPSGSGKTTLLNICAGYVMPSAGRLLISGRDVTDLPPRRRNMGMVSQNYALFPHMSVLENIAYGLRARGLSRAEIERKVAYALDMVQLAAFGARSVRELSGGQQQRVALARALVTEPAVVLADEPTGNLDSRGAEEMLRWLRRTVDEWGRTVVMVTHDPRMAAYADRIVFMKDGSIVDDTKLGPDKGSDFVFERMETLAER
jgi:ABC-type Fe3+/spermidine/putrescine transport system ATPase subunit